MPLVSVIIPLYNSESFISNAVESILNQTYSNIEVIVINDGSTDNSYGEVKKYESKKVKIFSQENKGASAARNLGLKHARGAYIQFLDADDYLSNNKIERQVNILIDNPDKVALCSTVYFFDGEDFLKKPIFDEWYNKNSNNPVDFLIKLYGGIESNNGGMIQPNAWLSPRKIIDKAGQWNEELSLDDDGEFFCRVLLASSGVLFVESAVNYYRKFRNGKNLSSQKTYTGLKSLFDACYMKKNYILAITDEMAAKRAFAKLFNDIAVTAYPEFMDLSKMAEAEANKLYNAPITNYRHTKVYKIVTSLFGWKASAWLSYYKSKTKKKKSIEFGS